jgi:dipeptidyl aminopeptidase/acylaminoacyl peptidase
VAKRPIEIDDLFRLRIPSDPRLAPDGRRIAFVVGEADPSERANRSSIWLTDIDGGEPRQFTCGAKREASPRWSPDGRHLAFLSNRDGDKVQVFVIPADGGEARAVTSVAGGVSTFEWSPDGETIAFVSRVPLCPADKDAPVIPAIREVHRIAQKSDGSGLLDGYSHIFVVPREGGEPRQLTHGDWDSRDIAWAPDGREIVFGSNRGDDRDWNDRAELYAVDATTGDTRQLTAAGGLLGAPSYSPDGAWIASVGRRPNAPTGANIQLWLVPAQGGEPRCLTGSLDLTVGSEILSDVRDHAPPVVPAWSADGQWLRVIFSVPGACHAYDINVADGAARLLLGGDRQILSTTGPSDGLLVFDATDLGEPGDLYVRDPGGVERRLTALNRSLLDNIELARTETLDLPGADGARVQGWFMHGRGDGPRPTILQIHGGPHSLYGHAFFHELQLLVARGYNVLFTNPRGSRGYGEAFSSGIRGAWGDLDYRDLMAALDAIVERPDVDTSRLGVAGGSYGGYMTNWIVGHTDRFKAAVTMRSLSNLVSFYGTSDIGTWFGERGFVGTPWDSIERYWRMSPLAHVERIRTPLLILHGEQDLRCPLEQAEQLFVALRRLGKTTELARFPEESHGLSRGGRPDRRRIRLERIVAWFDRWLSG